MKNSRPTRSSRDRDNRKDRQMYRTTCDACGESCEVPFKPSGDKPVYCNDCFEKDSKPRSDKRRQRDSRERTDMYEAICDACGDRCEVPFKPSKDKPIYCSDCFGSERKSSAPSNNNQSTKQYEEISWKMDTIISLLEKIEANTKPAEIIEEKAAKKTVKKTPAKKTSAKKAAKKTTKK